MSEYLGLMSDGELYCAPEEERFVQFYKKNWAKMMEQSYYKSENIDWGHCLRPRLVYWGFLAGSQSSLLDEQLDSIAKVAVCIEFVHKASLLLDDFIDKDTMRHGEVSFYVSHGVEKTVMFTIHLLCMSLKELTDVFYKCSLEGSFYYKSMTSLIRTLYNMSLGVLMELDLSSLDLANVEKIKEIMDLETSSLIENSILLGYFLSGDNVLDVEQTLEQIGSKIGFAFQVLNDLEPFCSQKNEAHKGSQNTDVSRNRKNICFPVLMGLLSKRERVKVVDESDDYLIYLFEKYNVKQILIDDVHNMLFGIQSELIRLTPIIKRENWGNLFMQFVASVISVFENRLN